VRGPFTQLYVHYVWATWDRLPLITPEFEAQIYASIATKCRELDCEPLAIGGIEDHIHLLVKISPSLSISTLVKEIKGSSSHLMTHILRPGVFFKWQGAYGAFSVSHDAIPTVTKYIRNQKAHHAAHTLIPNWEQWEEKVSTQTLHSG
jgi:REP element-mobilizing transposase RayT